MRAGGPWERAARTWVLALGMWFFVGCGGADGGAPGTGEPVLDPGPTLPSDAGFDAGSEDTDAGSDIEEPSEGDGGLVPKPPSDAGTPDGGAPDAGPGDAGTDAGTPGGQDGGSDAGTPDAGVPPILGGPAQRSPHWRASYPAGVSPGGLAVADFNQDGLPDVAVNAMGRGFVSQYKARPGQFVLLLNDGKGGLGKPSTRLPLHSSSGRIAAGYVDPDGVLDVMVGTRAGVYVWRGTPEDGSFSGVPARFGLGVVSSMGFWPGSWRASAFSWAGGPSDDSGGPFAEAGLGRQSLAADGTFQYQDFAFESGTPVISLLESPVAAVVADFNRDGFADVVLSSEHERLRLLTGNPSGRFSSWPLAPRTPLFLETADLDDDGHLDLVTASKEELQRYWGRSTGEFIHGSPIPLPRERPATGLALGDVDGDNRKDIVLLHREQGLVSIWRGSSPGRPEWLATGRFPSAAAVADLDRDGRPELLVAEAGDNVISAYSIPSTPLDEKPFIPRCPMALPDAVASSKTPAPLASMEVGLETETVTVGDFDGNGHRDLALPLPGRGVRLVLGQGGGKFQLRDTLTEVQVHGFAAGDFNDDGRADLAAFTQQPPDGDTGYSPVLRLLWSDGQGNFPSATDVNVYAQDLGHLVAADFNRDGRMDVGATVNTPCTLGGLLLLNQGRGVLEPRGLPDHNWEPDDQCGGSGPPAIGDFNGDGTLDFLHATLGFNLNYTDEAGTVVPGEGFENPLYGHVARTAGDVDGDGAVDLVLSATLGEMTVLRGDGAGTLQAPLECRLKAAGQVPLQAVDVNGDGITDLLGRDKGGSAVAVALGKGRGHYHPVRRYSLDFKPLWVGAVDLLGDEKPELVVLMEMGGMRVFPTPTP